MYNLETKCPQGKYQGREKRKLVVGVESERNEEKGIKVEVQKNVLSDGLRSRAGE